MLAPRTDVKRFALIVCLLLSACSDQSPDIIGEPDPDVYQACAKTADNEETFRQSLAGFKTDTGIELSATDPALTDDEVTFAAPSEDDYASAVPYYVDVIRSVTKRFSPALIGKSGLKSIRLSGDLKLSNRPVSGIAFASRGLILLNVTSFGCNAEYAESLLGHEFFHLLHMKDNWAVGGDEAKWLKLNTPGFGYFYDAKNLTAIYNHPWLGLVSKYAAFNHQEDAAETFGAMCNKTSAQNLAEWIKTDATLKGKVEYLQSEILKIDSRYTPAFWQGIADGSRTSWDQ